MTEIRESVPLRLTESEAGMFEIQLISPGQGSSGYYPESTLQEAARSGVFAKGTQTFLDHPTESERFERPERSVRDLAGSLLEAAAWNGTALVAKTRPYSMYAPLLAEAKDDIGMSIRAAAEVSEREIDGETRRVVERITDVFSVDYVTRAGRGGRVLSVLESVRAGLREGSVDAERDALSAALPGSSYVVDFDPAEGVVVYRTYNDDEFQGMFRQGYALDGNTATLTGDREQVRQVTTYVPVSSAGQSSLEGTTSTESTKELIMPQIEEAELAQLREDAGRVAALEAERDTEKARADKAESALAADRLAQEARKAAGDLLAESDLPDAAKARIAAAATPAAKDDGSLDAAALKTAVEAKVAEERAYIESLMPAGVTGFGQSQHVNESKPVTYRSPWSGKDVTIKEA